MSEDDERPAYCWHPGKSDVPGWKYCTECRCAWKVVRALAEGGKR